ncbi:hypothetical protein VOLCADRAFT_86692 [Volvox carteri f. nagariensis]|uniref:Uncharacterized protein n=1 Tax=Volvox carteri f. nagariensis TaxID=3068 RepID=D8TJC5_VOLCA|nr:uncharacterized protein VOLCADRAFT_86692 [Volvox carteri f. nagariensis]EFJ52519.1 hypothetical protein VOLCADRAFT_86692 [Volvox carteri f. nagariensis]|eukprot:XP_002946592.1 hypothetical protein VOLCADRAFT_86692 [Volvox carteri f. nagariensis]
MNLCHRYQLNKQLARHGVVQAQVAYVDILPPKNVVTEETIVWPLKCFQLLLVASEYCAALHEFMAFTFPNEAFPNDWAALKAQVAEHARQFIRSSDTVPPPAVQEGCLRGWQQLNAHAVWAAFTHCYFHGLPRVAPDEDVTQDWMDASRWLHRLVGDHGWRTDGPVYCAADVWVKNMLARLQQAFPESVSTQWTRDLFGTERGLNVHRTPAVRGDMRKLADGDHRPIVHTAHRTCGGVNACAMHDTAEPRMLKRFRAFAAFGILTPPLLSPLLTLSFSLLYNVATQWKVQDQEAPRTVRGSCGVPGNFGQTDNCALGFLVLADVVESFCEVKRRVIGQGGGILVRGIAQQANAA